MDEPVVLIGDGIKYAQICAQIGALRLEGLGISRKGPSLLPRIKAHYGVSGSREDVIAHLESLRDKMLASKRAGSQQTAN